MASQPSSSKVLIVGAGLGGLALAQGLKHANPPVPFQIFERDASSAFRAQGYRIRITPEGAAGLKKVLPPRLWDAFEATCSPVPESMGSRLDAGSGEPVVWARPSPAAGGPMRPQNKLPGEKFYNADRTVLRNILLSGLEEDIVFGKKFSEYKVNEDDSVTVQFDDGSSAQGSVLVGADGIRSAVRRQLLPDFTLLDSEGRAIFGKTLINSEIRDASAKLSEEMCLVGEGPDASIKMLCDSIKFTDSGLDASLRSSFHVPEDYIYWVIVFRKDVHPRQDSSILQLTAAESRQLSLELSESWHESIRTVLSHQLQEATSTLVLSTCSIDTFLKQWESLETPNAVDAGPVTLVKGPVTLLGDSAHPMTPVGGVGANTAFQEAADLSKAMAKVLAQSWKKADAIMAYQGLMAERAKDVIHRSHMGGGHFFGMRPVEELKAASFDG